MNMESFPESRENQERIFVELHTLHHQIMDTDNCVEYSDDVAHFVKKLHAEGYLGTDLDKVRLFHLVASSTPSRSIPSPFLDLPGKIFENFIRESAEKYLKK